MSVDIITQFRAKPGCSRELRSVLLNLMPHEQRPEGCLEFTVRQNQDDANDLVTEQRWQSRQQAERWRVSPPTATALRTLIAEPMLVRCFEAVDGADPGRLTAARASASASEREVPKVSTPDALGG